MKVTITKAEIAALIINVWCLPADTTVEVVDTPATVKSNREIAKNLENGLKAAGCMDAWYCILPEKKIAAIKQLRELIPNCGLAQAKYAIEDWDTFLSYVNDKGIPNMASGAPLTPWRQ